ncbi:MAG: hypothetical protein LH624_19420 [Cryobacterium sp.]|nr:hypothetical protein [Cryobacterium sp.]
MGLDPRHRWRSRGVAGRPPECTNCLTLLGARAVPGALISRVRHEQPGLPLAVIGFSQGGMLACDAVLHNDGSPDGLALLFSSRLDIEAWTQRSGSQRVLPVLVSYGHADEDLAVAKGEALSDYCFEAGADVKWIPFREGHVIPLVVWRGICRFLAGLCQRGEPISP